MSERTPERRFAALVTRLAAVTLVAFASWLIAGCATSTSSASAGRPGDGLREYRRLVTDLRKATEASRQSVQRLAAASQTKSNAAFARFDELLSRLEVVSIKARSRADAMEKRGAAYFDEWAEEIAGNQDAGERKVTSEQFATLHQHFESIRRDTRLVRQEFRKYLDGLRALRGSSHGDLNQVTTAGETAEWAMDKLLATLQSALAIVESGAGRPLKMGGNS